MIDQQIKPGDLVTFNFWSTYLAQCAVKKENGRTDWVELLPGDQGLVVWVESNYNIDDIVVVMFSRPNKLLRVHVNQLKRNNVTTLDPP